jgi:cytochrome oxidase Cu insertion factor (SCO1/SenC/PrrC family)
MHVWRVTAVALTLLAWALPVRAHVESDAVGHHLADQLPVPRPAPPPPPDNDQQSRNFFTDLPLLTQDGDTVRFYTDVLKDRVVLINFIYTNCTDACPLQTYKLKQVKDAMGDRFGRDVFFISISVDPENDPPEALKKFAQNQKVDVPGWVFLTGDKANIDHIVAKLGQYNAEPQSHSTLLLAGNVKNRHWSKIPPMSPVLKISLKLEELARSPQRRTGG